MPQDGPWATLRDHLVERIPSLTAAQVASMLAAGQFVGADGMPVPADAPFVPRSLVWVHRELPDEVPVPFDLTVLYVDERIVVVEKPHFLATTPRGSHVRETALARLRAALGLPRLAPAHRLDRLTAGVLVFTTEQRWRGAYQGVFAAGGARKEYLACAALPARPVGPTTVRLHLSKPHGQLAATVVDGAEPNCATHVVLVESDAQAGLGLYRLTPTTGRTHQLRATMAWLGVPISGDPLYPVVREVPPDDFSTPLGLIAARLRFTDPVDGSERDFVSHLRPPPWRGGRAAPAP
jgi:tRNA pseudouridine32 synthase/23S rRNA pseudouridine746 synthase